MRSKDIVHAKARTGREGNSRSPSRRPGIGNVLVRGGLCVGALLMWGDAVAQGTPSGCTSIADVPPTYGGIQYGAAIQGLFDDFNGMNVGCTMCHFTPPPTPSGHLNLDDGKSWSALVGVASWEDAALTYVVPGHPEQSLLFAKINCDTPPIGARMPYGFPSDTLTPEQQALVWDWIAAGAPVGVTDGIFRNGFDPRGFAP